jgi:hypothetical protein
MTLFLNIYLKFLFKFKKNINIDKDRIFNNEANGPIKIEIGKK